MDSNSEEELWGKADYAEGEVGLDRCLGGYVEESLWPGPCSDDYGCSWGERTQEVKSDGF